MTVTLLQNARQQFFDSNGDPLVGGLVYTYIPSTTTPKTTWSDSAGTVPNANPIVLDSLGSAAIWGSGVYRQLVKDSLLNTIWDAETSDVSGSTIAALLAANNTFTGTNTFSNTVTFSSTTTFTGVATFSAAARGSIVALTDGATITPNFAAGNFFSVTLGGNRTLANPTNMVGGQQGVIVITQDGTGNRTLAYGANWKFSGGTPVLSTAGGAVDLLSFYAESASRVSATLLKNTV